MENYVTRFIGKEIGINIDRPIGSKHPKYGFVYGVNYGFVPDTKAPDGEEIDAYLIGIDYPVEKYTGKCIAVVHRTNDRDDKLIIIPSSVENVSNEDIIKAVDFQERFFKSEIIRRGWTKMQ
ncbi:MAG: inorganic pyrophosphatase [Candidatus Moranbacteria bacterium]|nr:inorganic pyrophosphatase [Candidatus Moranbacteria bacterium]